MLGADYRGAFLGGTEFKDLVVNGEGVFREASRGEINVDFFAAGEGAEIGRFAFGNGHDDAVIGKKPVQREIDAPEGFFVGFVGDRKVAGEEDDAGGVGIGKMDRAEVGEGGHGKVKEILGETSGGKSYFHEKYF